MKKPGRNCRAGRNYPVNLIKKKGAGPPWVADGPVRPYRKKDRMDCGDWFAMDRAWIPSCCLTCSD